MTYTRVNGYYVWTLNGKWILTPDRPDNYDTAQERARLRWHRRYDSLEEATRAASELTRP